MNKAQLDTLAGQIIGSAIKVHRSLGPGLLESAYHQCLRYELSKQRLSVESNILYTLTYEGMQLKYGYRPDLIIEKSIIVENKTVDNLLPVHEAQLLTYLRLTGCKLGFLLNWNVELLKYGIKRMVLGLEE